MTEKFQPKSGSARLASEPDFLVIGKIIKPHGIKGEVSVKVLTDFSERFDELEYISLGDDNSQAEYTVKATRWHKERVLMTFAEIPDRAAAETLRGLYLKIPIEEAMPLEPGAYYHYQLINLNVVTDTGEHLGRIAEIIETGANDVYVVQGEKGEILLPVIKEVILSIDLEARLVTAHLLEGL
ncbi:MAG TPA: 16S rRNA processing protein RimM [Chloroflexi bacterium]|nr:16S rRNA processing protein RimM [Chloroflexota bacterium]